MRRFRQTSDSGAALAELAIIFPIIFALAIGTVEIGFLAIDYLTVTNAAREGARTGAAAADYDDPGPPAVNADDLILESVEEAACNLKFGQLESVTIFKAEADGSIPTLPSSDVNVYENTGSLNCDSAGHGLSAAPACCPWGPASRDRMPPVFDDIGVEVVFSHDGVTGLFPFPTVTWSETAVLQIEPDTRGQQ